MKRPMKVRLEVYPLSCCSLQQHDAAFTLCHKFCVSHVVENRHVEVQGRSNDNLRRSIKLASMVFDDSSFNDKIGRLFSSTAPVALVTALS